MFTVINRGELDPTTEHEIENFNSRLKRLWLTEHNEDGTHRVFLPAYIPSLDASKITTGVFTTALIPNLDASKITTGTFATARIPNLDASKITTGTFADALLSSNVALINFANIFTSNQRVNAGVGVNIAPGATGEIKLSGGLYERSRTVALGEWTSYTPTWTNLTVGNGTVLAKYSQIGNIVFVKVNLIWGSTTSIASANVQVNFPVNAVSTSSFTVSRGEAIDSSASASYEIHGRLVGATTQVFLADNGTSLVTVSATVPFTWAVNDELHIAGFYEI